MFYCPQKDCSEPFHYGSTNAVIMVCDCCDEYSFDNIKMWYDTIKSYIDYKLDNMPVIIVANKIDRIRKGSRFFSDYKGAEEKAKALNLGCIYMETSAKSGENIQELFQTIAQLLVVHSATPYKQVCT